MDRDEEVALVLVGDRGAALERQEGVGGAGQDDAHAEPRGQPVGERAGELQRQVLLGRAARADGAGLGAAVAGVEDDRADAARARTAA